MQDETKGQVNPEMIHVARESREMTQAELARRLGVRQSKVSKAEAGLLPLTDEEVARMAHILDYPSSFFRWTDAVYGFASYEMFHRRRQKVTARCLNRIHADMNIRQAQLRHLLRSAAIESDGFMRIDPDEYDGSIVDVARAVRAAWHLPPGPVRNITETIEGAGGVIIPHDFRTRQVDAVSQWLPDLPPVFLVNIEIPADRLRLTLAHELGHIIMHTTVTPTVEDEANLFAQEFLMPAHEIQHMLLDVSLARLADLKQYWRVSMWALAKRAYDLGAVTYRQFRRFCMRMTQLGYRKMEPIEIEREQPQTFRELLNLHMRDLDFSVEQMKELLGTNSVDRLMGSPPQGRLELVI